MTTQSTILSAKETEVVHEKHAKTLFGFWVYIMSDCVIFATLFATYVVLHNNTFGGPGGNDIFDLSFALIETLILLTSSFTAGLALLAARHNDKEKTIAWLGITLLLGISFLVLEVHEFARFVAEGNSWHRSGFLTAFFTLVGTHGLHVTLGSLWMVLIMIQIWIHDLSSTAMRRLACLGLFWHFLDIVWIFIFTIVYIMGVAG
jgi:cytochrome o ubiquinol oxidase subunit 3